MNNGSTIPKISDEVKESCLVMLLLGFEQSEIATRANVNFNTLRGWVKKGNWLKRKEEYDKLQAELHPVEKKTIVKAFAGKDREQAKKIFLEKSGEMAAEDIAHWTDTLTPDERLENATNIAALNGAHRKNLALDEEKENGERGHISLHFLTHADSENFVKLLPTANVKEIEDKPNEPTAAP
ncbi:MAG: hypothetical protein WBD81_17915 [Collimonas pratensis]|uniref:hypothetical protein n=1 Tax=Collimonas pratensis TaxID=279113 RepID=UPI003C761CA8